MKKTTNERHEFMSYMEELNKEDAERRESVDFYDDIPLVQPDEADSDDGFASTEHGMKEYPDFEASSGVYKSCNCLPSCTSIHYDAEISQSMINSASFHGNNDDNE